LNRDHYWTKPEKPEQLDITADEILTFRSVFLHNAEGREVLKWLLLNLGLYRPVTDLESAVLQNFAIKILCTLDLAKQEQLESMIEYYTEIAAKDALHPVKRDALRRKMNVGQPDS